MSRLAPTPYLLRHRALQAGAVHLLPTPNVVVLRFGAAAEPGVSFVMPHRTVITVDGVAEGLSLSPNFIKCLLGPPRSFLGKVMAPDAHPMLAPFSRTDDLTQIRELLVDLRSSLTVTPDEADFIAQWDRFELGDPIPTGDRAVQRLCLRYAGQAPAAVNALSRLSRTLDADDSSGHQNSLGEYADASHFARACKAHTGRTPSAWRNLSQPFY